MNRLIPPLYHVLVVDVGGVWWMCGGVSCIYLREEEEEGAQDVCVEEWRKLSGWRALSLFLSQCCQLNSRYDGRYD